MRNPTPNITVPVDLTNPGQFFACCGLLELADRLWPGAEGWFDEGRFLVACRGSLFDLLGAVAAIRFDVGDDSDAADGDDNDADLPVKPIALTFGSDELLFQLDWWTDKSVKPWAGSMKERVILRAMLDAIDPSHESPFDDLRRVQYQSPRLTKAGKMKAPAKKEPFYFDPRRGNKSHPLDCGFSPDTHKMECDCCPALEALCFIGLQRARPAATDTPNRSRYTVWTKSSCGITGLPANLIGAVACGMVPWPSLGTYVFDNYFRTDQRKHKSFSQAMSERGNHV